MSNESKMRPTTGKVMQAMFNILGPLNGRSFLDVFSGSGRVSIEALKKGATSVVSIEADRRQASKLRDILPKEVELFCMDVRRAIPKLYKSKKRFDIVFTDHPFYLGWPKILLEIISASNVVADNGIYIMECGSRELPEESIILSSAFEKIDERHYGDCVLLFFRTKRGGEA